MMEDTTRAHQQLLKDYITLCQKALAHHSDTYPYKQIFDAIEEVASQNTQPVTVTITDPIPASRFTLNTVKPDAVEIAPKICGGGDGGCCGGCTANGWIVESSFLQHVLANPDDYMAHPARLDWNWLNVPEEDH